MTVLPADVKVHLALGYIDMRKRMDSIEMQVQVVLEPNPRSGQPMCTSRGTTRAA